MDRLKQMAVFAEVMQAGSFSAAARRLEMTASAVSQHIRQLEQSLGLVLLHRSTRRLAATEAGTRFNEGCAEMVAAARRAEQALHLLRDEPEGELRLAAPIDFGGLLAQALAPLRRFPRLSVQLLLDDRRVDLIEERVDIAIRVGSQPDSNQVARPLGVIPRQLCAAPAYLASHGMPQHPQDLLAHDWLCRPGGEWLELSGPSGQLERLRVEGRARANQVSTLHALCIAGWGIHIGVGFSDRQALAEGRLLAILPDWHLSGMPAHAVTLRRDAQPAKVRHTLDILTGFFRQADYVLSSSFSLHTEV